MLEEPTPERLLAWWRALETTWSARINRVEDELDFFAPEHTDKFTYVPRVVLHCLCTHCKGRSWRDDPRGVQHRWHDAPSWDGSLHSFYGRPIFVGNCRLLDLRQTIRTAEQASRRSPTLENARLAEELLRLAAAYESAARRDLDEFVQRVDDGSKRKDYPWRVVMSTRVSAAFHIAQMCALSIEPTVDSVRAYAAYLQREAETPHGAGDPELEQQINILYVEAASTLESLVSV